MLRRLPVIAIVVALAGCDTKSEDENAEKSAAAADKADESDDAEKADGPEADGGQKKKKKKKTDFGEGSMVLGGKPFEGSAKAKMKNTSLIVKIGKTTFKGNKGSRKEMQIIIQDFKGPGDYVASERGTQFIGVGADGDEADKGEKEANAEAKKAIRGSNVILMEGVKVTIDAADDNQVSGTFTWDGGGRDVKVEDGKFRAVFKKKK